MNEAYVGLCIYKRALKKYDVHANYRDSSFTKKMFNMKKYLSCYPQFNQLS
jgi:hypothetical protein